MYETITESGLLSSGSIQNYRFPVFPFGGDLTRKIVRVSHSQPLTARAGGEKIEMFLKSMHFTEIFLAKVSTGG